MQSKKSMSVYSFNVSTTTQLVAQSSHLSMNSSTFKLREGSDVLQDVPPAAALSPEQNKDRATFDESLACKAPETDLACDLEFRPGTVMM
jgi:hypothetical protein